DGLASGLLSDRLQISLERFVDFVGLEQFFVGAPSLKSRRVQPRPVRRELGDEAGEARVVAAGVGEATATICEKSSQVAGQARDDRQFTGHIFDWLVREVVDETDVIPIGSQPEMRHLHEREYLR